MEPIELSAVPGSVKILVNGIRINARHRGQGEPNLIFLHYWGGSNEQLEARLHAYDSAESIARSSHSIECPVKSCIDTSPPPRLDAYF